MKVFPWLSIHRFAVPAVPVPVDKSTASALWSPALKTLPVSLLFRSVLPVELPSRVMPEPKLFLLTLSARVLLVDLNK